MLLALDRYFRTYEKVTPDFVARAWLGEAYAGEQQFRGRSTDRQQFDVPMRYLAEKGAGRAQNLVLQKEGAGRLYYRVGMQLRADEPEARGGRLRLRGRARLRGGGRSRRRAARRGRDVAHQGGARRCACG